MTITFLPLAVTSDTASGVHSRRLSSHGFTETAAGAFGTHRRRLRSLGTSYGGSIDNTPEIPALGIHRLYRRNEGATFSGVFAEGWHARGLRSFGYAGAAGAAGGAHTRQLRSWGRPEDVTAGYGLLVARPFSVSAYGGQWFARATDAMAFDSPPTTLYTAVASAILALGSAQGGQYRGDVRANDAVTFGARLNWLRLTLAEDGLALGGSALADYRVLARAVSRLLIRGEARHLTEALSIVTDALVFGYIVDALALGAAEDTLLLRASVEALYHAFALAVDALLLQGTAAAENHMFVLVADGVVLGGAVAHDADLTAVLRDSLGFAVSLSVDSGDYIAWAMNTETTGLSRYTNYPYNSFAQIGGAYYGVASDGLYRLEGADDNGEAIAWQLRLGLSDLGDRLIKRIPEMYYAFSGSITYIKVVSVDEVTGERNVAVYRAEALGAANTRENRKGLAAGIKSVDWDFILEGEGEFALDGLTLMPLSVNRRTRN